MATKEWRAPVERVTADLRDAGPEVRLEELADGTPTAQAAATAVGCEPAQTPKSPAFECDGKPGAVRNDARVHVGTHGLHYGSGIFEGIRAYETAKGSAVFRLSEHLKRFENSARLLGMELGYSVDALRQACHDVIAANGLPECYLRPIAFFG